MQGKAQKKSPFQSKTLHIFNTCPSRSCGMQLSCLSAREQMRRINIYGKLPEHISLPGNAPRLIAIY